MELNRLTTHLFNWPGISKLLSRQIPPIFVFRSITLNCQYFCVVERTRKMNKSILLVAFLFCSVAGLNAQAPYKIATDRLLWHDNIDKQQRKIMNDSGTVTIVSDPVTQEKIKAALITGIDDLQRSIETDTSQNTNTKKKYLRNTEYLLRGYNENWAKKDFSPSIAPELLQAFKESINLDKRNESIKPVVDAASYPVGKIIVECFLYPSENPGVAPSRIELIRKYCGLHPDEIFSILRNNTSYSFTDSLIAVAGHRDSGTSRYFDKNRGSYCCQ
jgi:hypothetical protein